MKNKTAVKKWMIVGVLFVILLLGGTNHASAAKQIEGRVLFISSYSYAWETVPQQMEGLREALNDDVVLDYQFMDTKNVDTEESIRLFYEQMKYFLQMVEPYDVIVVGDDAAFQFALEYRQELFAGIPIIFEGVNNADLAVSAGEDPLISGVIESLSYEDTLKVANGLYPQATQVVAILDDTVTGEGERKEFYKYESQFPDLEFQEINASELSQEEFLTQVQALGEESILLYIMCSEDGDGNTYASAEAVEMVCDAAKIPTFSIVSHGMGRGFLGGEIVSQEQMGAIAGEMVQQILDGMDSSKLEVQTDSPRTFCFDENVMNQFHITKSQLPENVEIINHEETFYEKYQNGIFVFAAVVVILLLLIGILAIDNKRKKKMNAVISRVNENLRLTSDYDSLTSLPNRRVFMEDLEKSIAQAQAFGVIMYDLDNFKNINDVYGHAQGDAVLKELAERSMALSNEKLEIYRLAGDEFIAIVKAAKQEVLESYAKAIQKMFEKPYQIAGKEQYLHSSIGIACFPKDGEGSMELLVSVDKAMYAVKNAGKNGIAFYREDM